MGYRIEHDEPLADGLKRIAIEQIEAAIESLRGSGSNRRDAVHRCRKSLKKERALLRLVRFEIGEDLYRQENAVLRDIAAGLSAMRDADVMIETFISFRRWAGARLVAADTMALATTLEESRARLLLSTTLDNEPISQAIEKLESACERARHLPIERNRFITIESGIKRIYRAGRKGYATVLEDPTAENVHEWRKSVKYLWYICRLIGDALKRTHDTLVADLDDLAGLLGEDRDLELLRDRAVESTGVGSHAKLVHLIDRRREELQEKAKSLGARIYSRRPKAFVKRIRSDWDEWRPITVVARHDRRAMEN